MISFKQLSEKTQNKHVYFGWASCAKNAKLIYVKEKFIEIIKKKYPVSYVLNKDKIRFIDQNTNLKGLFPKPYSVNVCGL